MIHMQKRSARAGALAGVMLSAVALAHCHSASPPPQPKITNYKQWVTTGPDLWHTRSGRDQPVDLSPYVSTDAGGGSNFALVAGSKAASLVVSASDFPGVVRVVNDLQADIQSVSGVQPAVTHADAVPPSSSLVVLIGTVGQSPLIDGLVSAGKLDTSSLMRDGAPKWETWITTVVSSPISGVDRALVIAGSDQRGTIFGTYDLSRQIGVSPWYFFDDVTPAHRPALYVLPGVHTLGEPAVKYRGIFINDENPNLGNWVPQYFGPSPGYPGGFNSAFYKRVFEVMLRLRANYLWPAEWSRAFDLDDPTAHDTAKAYGIVMGTSHDAPMDRGIQEWDRKPTGNGQWSFVTNAPAVEAYWKFGIQRMVKNGYEDVVTIGMRGTGDTGLVDPPTTTLLFDIIQGERNIIGDVTGKDVSETPQVWTLYKEVLGFYDQNPTFRPPSDVTVNWCDDNWGNLIELPTPSDKPRGGGYGIYYHFDYVGGGRNYKWADASLLPNTWEQLHLAYAYGVDRLWVANAGDLKTNEVPTEFFLDYAWSPVSWSTDQLSTWEQRFAAEQFGSANATEIADVLHTYARLQSRRKPELLNRVITLQPPNAQGYGVSNAVVYNDGSTFSLTNYREMEQVVAEWDALAAQSATIGGKLPAASQDAYYELVGYDVKATDNLYQLRLAEFKNLLYAAQGRAATLDMANAANAAFTWDANEKINYNHSLHSGKWNGATDGWGFQSESKIGYGGNYADSSWQEPPGNGEDDIWPPLNTTFTLPTGAAMGVAIDGSTAAWPTETSAPTLPTFSRYQSQPAQYIEVFSSATDPFTYTITPSVPWMAVDQPSGTLDGTTAGRKEVRAQVTISDWSQVPAGGTDVSIAVVGAGTTVTVMAHVDNATTLANLGDFVEANGYISMEASDYSRKVEASTVSWLTIPDIGRTGSGVTPMPVTASTQMPGGSSPHLEYDVYVYSNMTGAATIWAYLSPRNNVLHNGVGIRYAMSVDDDAPVVVNLTNLLDADPTAMNRSWERNTSENVARAYSAHTLTPGHHVVKFWMVDPTVVVQKLIVDTGGLQDSYLGPPESVRAADHDHVPAVHLRTTVNTAPSRPR